MFDSKPKRRVSDPCPACGSPRYTHEVLTAGVSIEEDGQVTTTETTTERVICVECGRLAKWIIPAEYVGPPDCLQGEN